MDTVLEIAYTIGLVIAGVIGAAILAYVVGYTGYGIVTAVDRLKRWIGRP